MGIIKAFKLGFDYLKYDEDLLSSVYGTKAAEKNVQM